MRLIRNAELLLAKLGVSKSEVHASDHRYAPTFKIAERRAALVTASDRATMVIDNVSKVVNDPLREQRIAMFRALNLT